MSLIWIEASDDEEQICVHYFCLYQFSTLLVIKVLAATDKTKKTPILSGYGEVRLPGGANLTKHSMQLNFSAPVHTIGHTELEPNNKPQSLEMPTA